MRLYGALICLSVALALFGRATSKIVLAFAQEKSLTSIFIYIFFCVLAFSSKKSHSSIYIFFY